MSDYHRPVMLDESLEYLDPKPGETIVDCTLGGGGHSIEIVKRLMPNGRLIGIDQDVDAIEAASERLAEFSDNVTLRRGNFSEISEIIENLGLSSVDGVLMDLGVSSHQLEAGERGFSFKVDAPLDMRMDESQMVTAEELVNSLSERNLADLIFRYGEERWARRIAKFIVDRRSRQKIETTGELVDVIKAAVPSGARQEGLHPATRTFQALRIAVNRELEVLQEGVEAAIELLSSGGRIVVISYHSLEDRIVKNIFARDAGKCVCPPGFPVCGCGSAKRVSILTKKPVVPGKAEVADNPRARSAKLRAVEKI